MIPTGAASEVRKRSIMANTGQLAMASAAKWLKGPKSVGRNAASGLAPGFLTERRHHGPRVPSGALTDRGGRGSAREEEMVKLCQQIGVKAAQKYRTVREALRVIAVDGDGTVSQSQMRYFFRAYDFPFEVADRFFAFLDVDIRDEVSFDTFVDYITPFLTSAMSGDAPPKPTTEEDVGGPAVEKIHEDFRGVLGLIGDKASQKHSDRQLRQVYRTVGQHEAGVVTKSEMRDFFRSFNLPEELADQFFSRLDHEKSGAVSCHEFQACLDPFIQPEHHRQRRPPREHEVQMQPLPPVEYRDTEKSCSESPRRIDPGVRKELRKMFLDIGIKLPLKFKQSRDAFRSLDLERRGRISRSELHGFFRGFGHAEDKADLVFSLLDNEGQGFIDFAQFMAHFDGVLGGPAFRLGHRAAPTVDMRLEKEVNEIASVINERLTTKYRNVNEAFRALDLDEEGFVSHKGIRKFLLSFNMPLDAADKFYNALAKNGSRVPYDEFVALFGGEARKKWPSNLKPVIWRLS